jgi:riboflavin synthase
MFTGIVEGLGAVVRLDNRGGSVRIDVDAGPLAEGVREGDSVAISGVCLTATEIRGGHIFFDVIRETVARTTLGALRAGDRVNMERSLKIGGRLGGHFVLGHVDGVGTIVRKIPEEGQWILEVRAPTALTDLMIEKGSVAIDGISLTLVAVRNGAFQVALIPYTLEQTTLGFKGEGDRVNLETDLIGKWIKKLLPGSGTKRPPGGLSEDDLRRAGFI